MIYQTTLAIIGTDDLILCVTDRKFNVGDWVLARNIQDKLVETAVLGCIVGCLLPNLPTLPYLLTLPARPTRIETDYGTLFYDNSRYEDGIWFGVPTDRSGFVYSDVSELVVREFMLQDFTADFMTKAAKEFGE